MRSLQGDTFGSTMALLMVMGILLGSLVGWLVVAKVTVYETTNTARLEVGQAVAPISARIGGRVVVSRLVLGRQVEPGEVLVELDSESEALLLREGRARLRQIAVQIEPLHKEIAFVERALVQTQQVGKAQMSEARALHGEADARSQFAEIEMARGARLFANGALAARDAEQTVSDAKVKRAGAEALRIAVDRIEADYQRKLSELNAELARQRRTYITLDAQQATEQATVERLEHELELRRIRAPVRGKVGEAVTLQVGAVLREGEQLGAVIPSGSLMVIAQFAPAVVGRIQVGQQAHLRLDGFPSIQYGSVSAVVVSVGSEPRHGLVRVDLSFSPVSYPAIPFQHGMPGSLEVEVERISPLTLVVRTVGRSMLGDRSVGR